MVIARGLMDHCLVGRWVVGVNTITNLRELRRWGLQLEI